MDRTQPHESEGNSSERETLVLDESAFWTNPRCLIDGTYQNANLHLPRAVYEELKSWEGRSFNSKRASFEEIMKKDAAHIVGETLLTLNHGGGLFNGGVTHTHAGSRVTVRVGAGVDKPELKSLDRNDNSLNIKVIQSALTIKSKQSRKVKLVTNKVYQILEAHDFGVDTCPPLVNHYTGQRTVYCCEATFATIAKKQHWSFDADELFIYSESLEQNVPIAEYLFTNEFLVIKKATSPKHQVLGRFDGKQVVSLGPWNRASHPIEALNDAQHFYLEALDVGEESRLIIADGPSGTGKTLLASAMAMEKMRTKRFDHAYYIRANVTVGEGHGFLPGRLERKVAPFFSPVEDNLGLLKNAELKQSEGLGTIGEVFKASKKAEGKSGERDKDEEAQPKYALEQLALAFIRGRSLQNSIIILDEAQNCQPEHVKALCTRPADGSVVIIIGDSTQVDTEDLSPFRNGLTHAYQRFPFNDQMVYRLRFSKDDIERGHLASLAVQNL